MAKKSKDNSGLQPNVTAETVVEDLESTPENDPSTVDLKDSPEVVEGDGEAYETFLETASQTIENDDSDIEQTLETPEIGPEEPKVALSVSNQNVPTDNTPHAAPDDNDEARARAMAEVMLDDDGLENDLDDAFYEYPEPELPREFIELRAAVKYLAAKLMSQPEYQEFVQSFPSIK